MVERGDDGGEVHMEREYNKSNGYISETIINEKLTYKVFSY